MVTTVSLNPCIDKTVITEDFSINCLNRIIKKREDGSGKGINVAVACRQIGIESECSGIIPENNSYIIENRLNDLKIKYDFLKIKGSVRVNTKIIDNKRNTYTELNESGEYIDKIILKNWEDRFITKKTMGITVLSGSVPPGVPNTIYRDIIDKCDGFTILDADDDLLRLGIEAHPTLIKPNEAEMERLFKKKFTDKQEIANACKKLIDRGIKYIVVSLGSNGAIITDKSNSFYSPALKVDVKSSAGAGDSMIAGLCAGIENGFDIKEVFRLGVAAAAASVTTEGTQLIDKEVYKDLINKVKIENII